MPASPATTHANVIETPISAKQLAEILPLHPAAIIRRAGAGRIPSTRLSARKVLFLPLEVQAWLIASNQEVA